VGERWEERGAYSELEFLVAHLLHGCLCPLGVLAVVHLDKGMALVLVDDAGLDLAKTVEDLAEFAFGAAAICSVSRFYPQRKIEVEAAGTLTLHRRRKGSGCTP
jgi:hypothetical protein